MRGRGERILVGDFEMKEGRKEGREISYINWEEVLGKARLWLTPLQLALRIIISPSSTVSLSNINP